MGRGADEKRVRDFRGEVVEGDVVGGRVDRTREALLGVEVAAHFEYFVADSFDWSGQDVGLHDFGESQLPGA